MTYVVARYEEPSGLIASIEQDKYCSSYKLCIYHFTTPAKCFAIVDYRGTYATRKTARAAMNRFGEN